MAIATAQVTVGTTAVELSAAPSDSVSGSSVAVQAPSGAVLYVGPSGVTTGTGWPIPAGQSFTVDLQPEERLFGILASGSGTAYVFRAGI